nr:MAG TPA: hypothetical protein [Caudoviricetes sp.]
MGVRGRTTLSEVYCLFHITFFLKKNINIINCRDYEV